jgi:hypothetical protein
MALDGVMALPSFELRDLLRSTLARLEMSSELSQDDPAFLELKNSLVRTIAELALIREEQPVVSNNDKIPSLQAAEDEI